MNVNNNVSLKKTDILVSAKQEGALDSSAISKSIDLMQLLSEIQKLLKKNATVQEQSVQNKIGLIYKIQEKAFENQAKSIDKQREGMWFQIGSGVTQGLSGMATGLVPGLSGHKIASGIMGGVGGLGSLGSGITDGLKTTIVDVEVNKLKSLEQYQSGNFKFALDELQNDNRKVGDRYSEIKNTTRELFDIIKQLGTAVNMR